jgi:hypothetical protein
MKYIKINAISFNDFTLQLRRMMVDVQIVQVAGNRYKCIDTTGNVSAIYDERKDHGLVYDYTQK